MSKKKLIYSRIEPKYEPPYHVNKRVHNMLYKLNEYDNDRLKRFIDTFISWIEWTYYSDDCDYLYDSSKEHKLRYIVDGIRIILSVKETLTTINN